ncbi:hypothetical protein BaRGS_00029885 [Batillaria attramentaria]|uniref:RING-type domain-containing protein n=1 Tax=Batillaria attramentaria TaxID=370345 RepID=A0ABD0JW08_9CAEN
MLSAPQEESDCTHTTCAVPSNEMNDEEIIVGESQLKSIEADKDDINGSFEESENEEDGRAKSLHDVPYDGSSEDNSEVDSSLLLTLTDEPTENERKAEDKIDEVKSQLHPIKAPCFAMHESFEMCAAVCHAPCPTLSCVDSIDSPVPECVHIQAVPVETISGTILKTTNFERALSNGGVLQRYIDTGSEHLHSFSDPLNGSRSEARNVTVSSPAPLNRGETENRERSGLGCNETLYNADNEYCQCSRHPPQKVQTTLELSGGNDGCASTTVDTDRSCWAKQEAGTGVQNRIVLAQTSGLDTNSRNSTIPVRENSAISITTKRNDDESWSAIGTDLVLPTRNEHVIRENCDRLASDAQKRDADKLTRHGSNGSKKYPIIFDRDENPTTMGDKNETFKSEKLMLVTDDDFLSAMEGCPRKSMPELQKTSRKKTKAASDTNDPGHEDDSDTLSQFLDTPSFRPRLTETKVFMLKGDSQQKPIIIHAGFENELRRLATFASLQAPPGVYFIRLAAAGFFCPHGVSEALDRGDSNGAGRYYEADLVCAFCGVVVSVMQFIGRQAMEVHKEKSPNCPLVRGHDRRNVSVDDVAQTSGMQYLSKFPTDNGASPQPGPASGGQAVLSTDGECNIAPSASQFALPTPSLGKDNAAAKPAYLAPGAVPQSLTVARAAVNDQATPTVQRLPGSESHADNRLGQTVADARGITSAPSVLVLTSLSQSIPVGLALVTVALSGLSNTGATWREEDFSSDSVRSSRNSTQPSSSPTADTENSAQTGNGQGEGTQERQVVTYEQLGIFAQRPKRQDMAVAATRINTFEAWPHADSHPASEMAEAGFYYTGHADLVRCFYCKGGLKTWERSDRPWVEHSRWFPRCPFVRLCKGQKFVDAIQKLNEAGGRPTITEDDVKREMQRQEDEERRNRPTTLLPTPPTVREIQTDSAEGAVGGSAALRADFAVGDGNDTQEMARRLEEENQEMKETTLCKMCQTREVNVLFLPCGHLVACAYCAPALRTCAMCRQPVKGTVRVQLDEEESVDV